MNDIISLDIQGAIARATLCQPPVNALNEALLDRLDAVLAEVASKPAVNVLWLRSDQKAFCAGADLQFMRECFATEKGRVTMIAFTRRLQEVFARVERLPLLTLAEIGGAALGGGFELALACDLRVVADSVKIGLPEVALGLLPAAGGTQRLTRLCGGGIARRLILGAELVKGSDAPGLGLTQWSAPAAELEAFARGLAERLAALPRAAVAASKQCIDAAIDGGAVGFEVELNGSRGLLANPDTQARVRRFLDKG